MDFVCRFEGPHFVTVDDSCGRDREIPPDICGEDQVCEIVASGGAHQGGVQKRGRQRLLQHDGLLCQLWLLQVWP